MQVYAVCGMSQTCNNQHIMPPTPIRILTRKKRQEEAGFQSPPLFPHDGLKSVTATENSIHKQQVKPEFTETDSLPVCLSVH